MSKGYNDNSNVAGLAKLGPGRYKDFWNVCIYENVLLKIIFCAIISLSVSGLAAVGRSSEP